MAHRKNEPRKTD